MNRICTPCFRLGRQAIAVVGVFAAGAGAEDVAVADGAVQPAPERRFVRGGEVLRPVLEELLAGVLDYVRRTADLRPSNRRIRGIRGMPGIRP
jgi:hypothetical protein